GAHHPRVPLLPHVHGSLRRDPVPHPDREGRNAEADGAMSSHPAERVDVLVLGSGEGGKYLAWHMGPKRGAAPSSWSGDGSAAPVRTSTVCRARTRSGARRSRRW